MCSLINVLHFTIFDKCCPLIVHAFNNVEDIEHLKDVVNCILMILVLAYHDSGFFKLPAVT